MEVWYAFSKRSLRSSEREYEGAAGLWLLSRAVKSENNYELFVSGEPDKNTGTLPPCT